MTALAQAFTNPNAYERGRLSLGFSDTLRAALILGHIGFGFNRVSNLSGFIARETDRIPAVLALGWDALSNWPNGFHAYLDGLSAKAVTRAGRSGLRKAFGSLSNRIYRWNQEGWGKPLAEEFVIHVASRSDIAVPAGVLSRYGSPEAIRNRQLTLTDAKKALNVSMATMQILAYQHDLYLVPPSGKGIPTLLAADKVLALREPLREGILVEETRKILNVGREVLLRIVKAGFLRRVPTRERIIKSRCFRRSEVEAFVSRCRGEERAVTADEVAEKKLLTIVGAARPGRSYTDVIRALLDGRLGTPLVMRGVRGLPAVRLDPAMVKQALPIFAETKSVAEVAHALGIAVRFVSRWAKEGHLKSAPSPQLGEVGLRFRDEDVEAFLQAYVPGGEAARMLGTPGTGVFARHLKFLNIHPVSVTSGDLREGLLYRREDLTPSVVEKVDRLRHGETLSLKAQRGRASAQVQLAAAALTDIWPERLRRVNNRFVDDEVGRVIQVISGPKKTIGGPYRFKLNPESLSRLQAAKEAHVALVPDKGETFLLIPLSEAMTLATAEQRTLVVQFDADNRPLEMLKYAHSLRPHGRKSSNPGGEIAAVRRG